MEPQVWESLEQEPLQALSDLYPKEQSRDAIDLEARLSQDHHERVQPFRETLAQWARRFNLTDDWCIEWAKSTVIKLYRYGAGPQRHLSYPLFDGAGIDVQEPGPFMFSTEAWDVVIQSRQEYERFVRQRLDRALKEYCKWVEATFRQDGWIPTPERRNRDHFIWLARFQVKGEGMGDVWRSLKGDTRGRRALEVAIRRTADQIGLKLRPY